MNNYLKTRLKLNQLIILNVHLGDDRKYFNTRIKAYILGYVKKIHIINLSFTVIQFRLLFKLITNIIAFRQRILVIKELDPFQLSYILNLRNVFYYDKSWIGGVLTNNKMVRFNYRFLENNRSGNSLFYLRYIPSLIFLFDINLSHWAFGEAINLEVPIAAIINTTSKGLEYVDYPILGNNKSFESLFLYYTFLRNSVLVGHQKQRLKILRIL